MANKIIKPKAYEEFQRLLPIVESKLKENETIRVEICGIEASDLQLRQDPASRDSALVIQGKDHNGNEVVCVYPAGHFTATIVIVPKKDGEKRIGFQVTEDSSDKTTTSFPGTGQSI
jgi:hypothetical protein